MKYLSAKLDIVFKMIFASEHNTDILADFLAAVLGIQKDGIKKITVLNPFLEPDEPDDKKSVLDLKVELWGERRVNVEIQVHKIPDMVQRLHFYKARMVTEQLSAGDPYTEIIPTSCVAILDYQMYGKNIATTNSDITTKSAALSFRALRKFIYLRYQSWGGTTATRR